MRTLIKRYNFQCRSLLWNTIFKISNSKRSIVCGCRVSEDLVSAMVTHLGLIREGHLSIVYCRGVRL